MDEVKKWKIVAADEDARKFAETADFMCLVCQELVWMPTICETCSKLFCQECVHQWAKNGPKSCPGCRLNKLPEPIQNNPIHLGVKRVLNKLRLKCPQGCPWAGDYWDAMAHVHDKCPLTTLNCEFCLLGMPRSGLAVHLLTCPQKPCPCPECKQGTFKPAQLVVHRSAVCPESLVGCSASDCKWSGPRKQLLTHESACPEQPITCAIFGCGHQFKRQHLTTHMSSQALQHVDHLLKQNADLLARLNQTNPNANSVAEVKKKKRKRDKDEKDSKEDDDVKEIALVMLPCETKPKCPYNGEFRADNPFGERCLQCNKDRRNEKVPCESGISPQCWKRVTPHPRFGSTCKPCRDTK